MEELFEDIFMNYSTDVDTYENNYLNSPYINEGYIRTYFLLFKLLRYT